MNKTPLNKKWFRMDEELDNEPTFAQAVEIRNKALTQMDIIREKTEKLEAELEKLNYLKYKYDNVECAAEQVASETKEWLDTMGFPANSNRRMTEKAYREYEELECYVGQTRQIYPGLDGKVAEIVVESYKGDGEGRMLRDERGNPVQVSILELCQYGKN